MNLKNYRPLVKAMITTANENYSTYYDGEESKAEMIENETNEVMNGLNEFFVEYKGNIIRYFGRNRYM